MEVITKTEEVDGIMFLYGHDEHIIMVWQYDREFRRTETVVVNDTGPQHLEGKTGMIVGFRLTTALETVPKVILVDFEGEVVPMRIHELVSKPSFQPKPKGFVGILSGFEKFERGLQPKQTDPKPH